MSAAAGGRRLAVRAIQRAMRREARDAGRWRIHPRAPWVTRGALHTALGVKTATTSIHEPRHQAGPASVPAIPASVAPGSGWTPIAIVAAPMRGVHARRARRHPVVR